MRARPQALRVRLRLGLRLPAEMLKLRLELRLLLGRAGLRPSEHFVKM